MQSDRYILHGHGFHCQVVLDLKEVKSIRRCAFWGKGWWYTCTLNDGRQTDIHVREEVDVLKLFEELNEKEH